MLIAAVHRVISGERSDAGDGVHALATDDRADRPLQSLENKHALLYGNLSEIGIGPDASVPPTRTPQRARLAQYMRSAVGSNTRQKPEEGWSFPRDQGSVRLGGWLGVDWPAFVSPNAEMGTSGVGSTYTPACLLYAICVCWIQNGRCSDDCGGDCGVPPPCGAVDVRGRAR